MWLIASHATLRRYYYTSTTSMLLILMSLVIARHVALPSCLTVHPSGVGTRRWST